MVFEIDGYKLYQNKKRPQLRYFSKSSSKGKPIDMPPGYKCGKNKKTGLPFIKRIKK